MTLCWHFIKVPTSTAGPQVLILSSRFQGPQIRRSRRLAAIRLWRIDDSLLRVRRHRGMSQLSWHRCWPDAKVHHLPRIGRLPGLQPGWARRADCQYAQGSNNKELSVGRLRTWLSYSLLGKHVSRWPSKLRSSSTRTGYTPDTDHQRADGSARRLESR